MRIQNHFYRAFSFNLLFVLMFLYGCGTQQSDPPTESKESIVNSVDQNKDTSTVQTKSTQSNTETKQKETSHTESVDFALSFDGKNDYVEILSLKYDGSHPLTIEVMVVPHGAKTGRSALAISNSVMAGPPTIVGDWGWELQGYGLVLLNQMRRWHFGLCDEKKNEYPFCLSADPVSFDSKIHLAGVFDGKAVRLFVNGHLEGVREPVKKYLPSEKHLLIGASWLAVGGVDNYFTGVLDELRISKVVRYTTDYTPTKRLEADEQTLALYHFDAGTGGVLKDASSNKNDGKIVGATWVKADEVPELSEKNVDDPATVKLLPARNLDAFELVSEKSSEVFRLDEEGALLANGTQPTYLATKQEFTNYHLLVEYQWASSDADDDAGIVVNATTKIEPWQLVSGIECDLPGVESEQAIGKFILVGKTSQLRIDGASRRGGTVTRALKNNPENPAGEWNTLEVVSDGGRFVVWVNGRKLLDARFPTPRTGRILLQSSRGDIRFRRMEVTSFDVLTEEPYRLARAGKWKEAAEKFENARQNHPRILSTMRGLQLAILYAAIGDYEAHEKLCKDFFEKYETPQVHVDSERPAKAYLISATATDPKLLAQSLAATKWALDTKPKGGFALWFFMARGMAEYRLKDYDEATRWFKKVIKSKNPMQRAQALPFAAMSEFRLGRVESAKQMLAQAKDAFRGIPRPVPNDYGPQWNDVLTAELVLHEAESLIGKAAVDAKPKPKPKVTPQTPASTFGDWQTVSVADLKGWSDPGKWWKAENGVVVAESKGGADLPKVHYLVWDGSIKGDFEIILEYRIVGTDTPQDAGFNFRVERPFKSDAFNLPGYQAELDTGTQYADTVKKKRGQRFTALGKLFGHIHDGKRTRMFQRNKRVTIDAAGQEKTAPLALPFDPRRVFRKSPEWNTCRVECMGDRVQLHLNNVLANEIIDGDPKKSSKGDAIALQYRPANAYRFEVKSLKYRLLK